jgi:rubrerythrin
VSRKEEIVTALRKFTSVEEILGFCIEQEEASAKLYSALAGFVDREEVIELFHHLSQLETTHRQKLLELKAAKIQLCVGSNAPEIDIRADLPLLHAGPNMGCREAIGLAIKKEIISATLYTSLAEIVDDETVRSVLLAIAEEETKHKHHFDAEYDKCVETDD